MAGLTREQRAAREAAQQQADATPKPEPAQCAPGCVLMQREGKTAEVREGKSVELMQALGWKLA